MNDLTCACIFLGQKLIRGEEADGLIIEIASSKKNETEFMQDVQYILSLGKQSLEYLSSKKTLYIFRQDSTEVGGVTPQELTEDMDVNLSVITAMLNLDQLVYLTYAIGILKETSKEWNGIYSQIIKVDDLMEDIFDEIPLHRLIPLNDYRRQMLAMIGEENDFLFPWYVEWNEESSGIFFDLSLYLADEYNGSLSDILNAALSAVLVNDKDLFNFLKRRASLTKVLPQVLAEDHLCHSLKKADEIACATRLPEQIVTAGRIDVAIRVAVQDAKKGVSSEKWRMEAALFGMGLLDEEREKILELVGCSEMEDAEISSIVTEMLSKLIDAVNQGFRLLPDPIKTFHELLFCDNPKLVIDEVVEWDSVNI